MSEEKKQQPNELMRGVDSEGFFTIRIHTSQGMEKILGTLVTSIDLVKAYFIEQHEKGKQASLIQPKKNGIMDGFRNKWR